MTSELRQLTIMHLTDVHFGAKHAFLPPVSPAGRRAASRGWPTLLDSLLGDWTNGHFADRGGGYATDNPAPRNSRVILAITGDFTETCADTEFADARAFVQG